jgi:Rrf2 family iron-sulfur cluster assembly transcriptional regulator
MAMVDLALQPQASPVGLATIAERQEIPLAYLEQIFARLKRANLVRSIRGPGGGYLLGQDAASVNIADIMLASEEPMKMTRCNKTAEDKAGCMSAKTRCLTHDLWAGLSDQIQHYLESITLADVVKKREFSVQSAEFSDKVVVKKRSLAGAAC